jgi:hypothetical protein
MVINTRPPATCSDTVKLNVVVAASSTYSIGMNLIMEIPQLYDILLMDAYKKDSPDLRHSSTYLIAPALSLKRPFLPNLTGKLASPICRPEI